MYVCMHVCMYVLLCMHVCMYASTMDVCFNMYAGMQVLHACKRVTK